MLHLHIHACMYVSDWPDAGLRSTGSANWLCIYSQGQTQQTAARLAADQTEMEKGKQPEAACEQANGRTRPLHTLYVTWCHQGWILMNIKMDCSPIMTINDNQPYYSICFHQLKIIQRLFWTSHCFILYCLLSTIHFLPCKLQSSWLQFRVESINIKAALCKLQRKPRWLCKLPVNQSWWEMSCRSGKVGSSVTW